jgi:hypothetical protein
LIFVLLRNRTVAVGVLVLLVFVFMSALVRSRVVGAARGATAAVLPAHRDWVDRTNPSSDVALVAGPGASDPGRPSRPFARRHRVRQRPLLGRSGCIDRPWTRGCPRHEGSFGARCYAKRPRKRAESEPRHDELRDQRSFT